MGPSEERGQFGKGIATLATTFSTAAFFLSGGEKVDKSQPPINAKSKDEESFVK
jgi:F-type H+-transporting ATPase subunit k